jgi:hypothetical protein
VAGFLLVIGMLIYVFFLLQYEEARHEKIAQKKQEAKKIYKKYNKVLKIDNDVSKSITGIKNGDIKISPSGDWCIRIGIPGPDMRFNWNWVYIHDRDLDRYIENMKTKYEQYQFLNQRLGNNTLKSSSYLREDISVSTEGVILKGIGLIRTIDDLEMYESMLLNTKREAEDIINKL